MYQFLRGGVFRGFLLDLAKKHALTHNTLGGNSAAASTVQRRQQRGGGGSMAAAASMALVAAVAGGGSVWRWRRRRWQWQQLGGNGNSCLLAWRQRGGTDGSLAEAAMAEALRYQLDTVVTAAAAAWLHQQHDGGGKR